MVEVSGSAVLVVERSGTWTGVDGAEGPLVDGGVEPSIADTAGQDGALLTRGDGQWGGSGVVFARLGGGVSVRVVPELTEHPGAEDDTKSWQGEVDVGVRVCLKMCGQFGLEFADLAVELDDDAHCGTGGRGECGGDRRGSGELLGAQRRRNVLSAGV